MPAPEQSPGTEEGPLLKIRPTGRSMEKDITANNILASVKEQVQTRPILICSSLCTLRYHLYVMSLK
uniref:Uncharacterized protein n=1 Tax=Periophthalmus magnuspinnatus TaxID=409849 RepID=A0A3B3ZSM9_9GOBI